MATILRTIDEMTLVGVYDQGKPNTERIALKTQREVNLGEYVVCLAMTGADGNVVPIPDNMLWLGEERVDAGHWVFVYTGPGQRQVTHTTNGEPAIVIHWNRPFTVFQDQRVIPVIFHLAGILTPRSEQTLAELVKRIGLPPGKVPSMNPLPSLSEMLKAIIAGKAESTGEVKMPLSVEQEMLKALLTSRTEK